MATPLTCIRRLVWLESETVIPRSCFFSDITDAEAQSGVFILDNPPSGFTYSFDDLGNLTVTPDPDIEPVGPCATVELALTPIYVGSSNNSAPIIDDKPDAVTPVNQPYSLTMTAVDPDGDTITYSASGMPPGLSVDSSTGVISGTPTVVGNYVITMTATDVNGSGQGSSEDYSLEVTSESCGAGSGPISFMCATATSFLAGQPASAAINGVIGASDAVPSSNWWATSEQATWRGDLGGEQCIDNIGIHFFRAAGTDRVYFREVRIYDADNNLVEIITGFGESADVDTDVGEQLPVAFKTARYVEVEVNGHIENGAVSTYGVVAEITVNGVILEAQEPCDTGGGGSLDVASMIDVSLNLNTNTNNAVRTAPIGVWQQPTDAGMAPFRVLTRHTDGGDYTQRHWYSERQFWSESGNYGISLSSRFRRYYDFTGSTPVQSPVIEYPMHAVWVPGADELVGFDKNDGYKLKRVTVTGGLSETLQVGAGDIRPYVAGNESNWSFSGTQGDVSETGHITFHSNFTNDPLVVIVDIINLTHYTLDFSQWDIPGLTIPDSTGGDQDYSFNHVSFHPNGLFLQARLDGEGSGSESDRAYIFRRSSPTATDWEPRGYVEGGHGAFGYAADGTAIYSSIGYNHVGIVMDTGFGSCGSFAFDLDNGTGARSPTDKMDARVQIGAAPITFSNSPEAWTGHSSGHASLNQPGVFLSTIEDPEVANEVFLWQDGQVNKVFHVDRLPPGSTNYYEAMHGSIRADGQRAVAVYPIFDTYSGTFRPGMVEYDLSQYYV